MASPRFLPLSTYREYSAEEMERRAAEFYRDVRRRRTSSPCSLNATASFLMDGR